jgi:glycosyltransferase involved in cell wall biosynthesis
LISALINTFNEELNLAAALSSLVGWVDELVVVDMFSNDGTREVAERFGARVALHERTDFVEPARAFGIQQCAGEWILILDADEIVPPALAARLVAIARGDEADVVVIPFRNYVLGAALSGGGWGPNQDSHPRFFRRDKLVFDRRIHSKPAPTADARTLRLPVQDSLLMLHFNYLSVSHVIQKLNRYTGIEAAQRFARGMRPTWAGTVGRSAKAFFNRYLRLRGYRDGWRGLFMCAAMGFYEVAIATKLSELHGRGSEEDIQRLYRAIAEETGRASMHAGVPAVNPKSPRLRPVENRALADVGTDR